MTRLALLLAASGALSAFAQGTAQSAACVADPKVIRGTVCTYDTQAQDSTFVVPQTVTALDITIVGGTGGISTFNAADRGAAGAQVDLGAVPVLPGQTLYLCATTAPSVEAEAVADLSGRTRTRSSRARVQPGSSTRLVVTDRPPRAATTAVEVRRCERCSGALTLAGGSGSVLSLAPDTQRSSVLVVAGGGGGAGAVGAPNEGRGGRPNGEDGTVSGNMPGAATGGTTTAERQLSDRHCADEDSQGRVARRARQTEATDPKELEVRRAVLSLHRRLAQVAVPSMAAAAAEAASSATRKPDVRI